MSYIFIKAAKIKSSQKVHFQVMITPMWGKFEQFRGDAGLSIILKRTLHGGRGDSQGWQLQLQVKRRAKVKLIICIFVYIHTSGPPVFS